MKLHWLFFAPPLAIAGLVAAVALLRSKPAQLIWKKRLPELALAATLAVPLIGGFAICNWASTGHFTDTAFMTSAINTPFRLDVATQKVWINSTQLFLSGIPDLRVNFDPEARKLPYAEFNKWLNENWFRDVNQDQAFRVAAYRFQGIADPSGYSYFEQTFWAGFLPILMIVAILLGLIRRNVPLVALATVATFFLWHISYAAQTRYAEAISTYYSYPAILSCAGLGLVFDRMRWHNGISGKLLTITLGGVVVTHLIFDFNLLAFNAQRNVPQALSAGFKGVTAVSEVSDKAIEAIRRSRKIHIPYLHWELLFWNYMRQNPLAQYSTGGGGRNEPGWLNLFSQESNIESGKLVARYPASGPDGLVYLGAAYGGGEMIFASGDGVEKQYPGDRNYFLIPVTLSRRPENQSLAIVSIDSNGVTGLGPADGVEFRVVAEGPNAFRRPSRWMTPLKGTETIELDPAQAVTGIVVEARLAAEPSKACTLSNGLPSMIRPEQSVCTASGGGQLLLTLASDVPGTESTNWAGTNYTVRWLKQQTRFTIQNPGAEVKAEIRMQLGINTKPKSAMVSYDGGKTPEQKVEKFLWAQGPQPIRFAVKVKPGENRFVLSTIEPADPLADGRPGALLLIGEMAAIKDEAPEPQAGLKRTKMNCYCGRTEAATDAAYRSMQTDGGKAIPGLFERNELIELQGQLPVDPLSISRNMAKLLVKGGPHANSTCWLPANLIE